LEESDEGCAQLLGRHWSFPNSAWASFSKAFSSLPLSRGSFVQGRPGMREPLRVAYPSWTAMPYSTFHEWSWSVGLARSPAYDLRSSPVSTMSRGLGSFGHCHLFAVISFANSR